MKFLILIKLWGLILPQCDTCLEKKIRVCIKDNRPIVIPIITTSNNKYYLMSNTKYLKQYYVQIDSTFKDDEKFKKFLISYYESNKFLPLNWNVFRHYSIYEDSNMGLLEIKKGENDKFTSYTFKEKNKLLNEIGVKMVNPWEDLYCNLWQLTATEKYSKELEWKLFNYDVLLSFSDGSIYMIDICPPIETVKK